MNIYEGSLDLGYSIPVDKVGPGPQFLRSLLKYDRSYSEAYRVPSIYSFNSSWCVKGKTDQKRNCEEDETILLFSILKEQEEEKQGRQVGGHNCTSSSSSLPQAVTDLIKL